MPGPSGTFAEEFDRLIAELGEYLNAAGSELNWMAGAMLDIVGVLMLSILGWAGGVHIGRIAFNDSAPYWHRADHDIPHAV